MPIWANAASTRKTLCTLSLLALLVGAAPTHPAAAAGDASGFITDLGSQAIHIMKDAGLSPADRRLRFETLMSEDFDLPRIAQSVLGRYWR